MNKNLKEKRTLWVLICLIGIVFVYGCSKEGKIAEKKVTIRYANWEVFPAQLKLHQEVVDKFRDKHPEINLKFDIVHGGIQKILVEMAAGAGPDVFYCCDALILAPLVEKKVVIDISPYIKEDITLGDYFPNIMEGMRYKDGIYGFPIYLGTTALIYNKSLFDKEGMAYPSQDWYWEDFVEAAKKLTKREEGKTIQYGADKPGYYDVIRSFGGDFFNAETTVCTLDSPETRDALQFILDLQNKYRVIPSITELEGEDKFKSGVQMFMDGRIGMFIAPSFILPTLRDIKNFEWDVAPMPKRNGKKIISSFGAGILCISSQSKHLKEAWEFVKFACGREGVSIFGKGRNSVPPIRDVAYATFSPPPENIRVFVDIIEAGDYSPPFPKVIWANEFFSEAVQPEIDLLFLNKQSEEETIRKISAKANRYLKPVTE